MVESESEEPKEEKKGLVKLAETLTCPVIPPHVKKIMTVIDKLDKDEIDDFGAVKEISETLAERKRARVEALKKIYSEPTEEPPAETQPPP